jgi:glucose-1-phosphate thymidylyltransferase
MKGIILAGGHGSRLYPLTKLFNKSLLPVYDKPMIYYPLETLKHLGCTEICIVSGKEHSGQIINMLGSGIEFDVEFTYKIQEEPGGIAQALGLCKGFAMNDNIAVCLGDNIFKNNFDNVDFNTGCHLFLKSVNDPERFGVPVFDTEDINKIIKIEEKPYNPMSEYAITGLYLYDNKVWDIIENLGPSTRGELEITDVNNWYVDHDLISYTIIDGYWSDAGTPDSLVSANEIVKNDER